MKDKFAIGLIVSNHFGVLSRVAALYGKRGYNIDALLVVETENPKFSRMIIVSSGDDYTKNQVIRQLNKLHDVKLVTLFNQECMTSVDRMLIKLNSDGENKARINELANTYSGKLVNFGSNFMTLEIAGSFEIIDEFMARSKELGIMEHSGIAMGSLAEGLSDLLSPERINAQMERHFDNNH